jgi:3D (Asp-Asp-Asp) domain-containing protein
MKLLIATFTFALLLAAPAFAREESLLARVTVYWRGESGELASWNGARLRAGHCAVDPKKIPFGSKVVFADATCTAVDSGPDVINRKAARLSGRTTRERGAIVVDRYFETKEQALAWAETHPHFMTVRVVEPGSSVPPVPSQPPAPAKMAQTRPPQTNPVRSNQPEPPPTTLIQQSSGSIAAVPPVYHRRRFAADDTDEFNVARYATLARPQPFPRPV